MLIGLEPFNKKSFLVQLLGFALLLTGNMTYNEIIEWKIFGLNKGMIKYANKAPEKGSEKSLGYASSDDHRLQESSGDHRGDELKHILKRIDDDESKSGPKSMLTGPFESTSGPLNRTARRNLNDISESNDLQNHSKN